MHQNKNKLLASIKPLIDIDDIIGEITRAEFKEKNVFNNLILLKILIVIVSRVKDTIAIECNQLNNAISEKYIYR